jgi:tetratricopeptide (TPR) repeat protein
MEPGFRRFWNAIKPPPAVPRRSFDDQYRRPFGGALKPPAAVRRILGVAGVLVLAGAGAWEAYAYVSGAPKRAQAVLVDGLQLMASGKYPQAIESFTRATKIWPRLGTGYLERGLAHLSVQDTNAAIEDFKRAIEVDRSLTEAHTALGSIYRQRGEWNAALNEFTVAIGLGSTVDGNYQRGQLYESLGQHQSAVDDYNLAIAQLPDAPYVYRARALSRENMGDRAGAEEDRRTAFSIEHPYSR